MVGGRGRGRWHGPVAVEVGRLLKEGREDFGAYVEQ